MESVLIYLCEEWVISSQKQVNVITPEGHYSMPSISPTFCGTHYHNTTRRDCILALTPKDLPQNPSITLPPCTLRMGITTSKSPSQPAPHTCPSWVLLPR